MTPLIKEACSLDADVALACVWFDMGTLSGWAAGGLEMPSLRLPFDKCGIVYTDGYGTPNAMLVAQEDEDVALVSVHFLRSTKHGPLFAVRLRDGAIETAQVEGEPNPPEAAKNEFLQALAEFLRRVHPVGCRAKIKRSATNDRRAAKGKAPLVYSWHTVEIEPPALKSDSHGGTHATPRLHQRRGHWRTLANGRQIWVRNCMVGDAARGTVWKDYRVACAA